MPAFLGLGTLVCLPAQQTYDRPIRSSCFTCDKQVRKPRVDMTVSEGAQALAGIVEASNDTVTLAAAIEAASFLDATPGEERQKLRGGHVASVYQIMIAC